jgi:hypothetical protein
MNQLPITITFIKKDGQLVVDKSLDATRVSNYIKNLEEGCKVDVTYQETADAHTLGQLAKVHACIDELSKYTGYEREELKDMVKHKAGLITDTCEYKSFADCSKEELSRAIEAVIKIGEAVDFPLA